MPEKYKEPPAKLHWSILFISKLDKMYKEGFDFSVNFHNINSNHFKPM